MPLQHINDDMLRRMARRVTRQETETLLAKLRERIPELTLRTTFITGFPGETDEQFEELVDFVRTQRFERLGVFTYSFEPDTPAARLPDHLPEEVKEERRRRLMEVQQEVAFAWNEEPDRHAEGRDPGSPRAGRDECLDRPLARRRAGRRCGRVRHRRQETAGCRRHRDLRNRRRPGVRLGRRRGRQTGEAVGCLTAGYHARRSTPMLIRRYQLRDAGARLGETGLRRAGTPVAQAPGVRARTRIP